MPASRVLHRYRTLLVLIIAGEMIFTLPFHTARFFRPTLLDVFGLSNTELGDLFAAYGVVAMLSYFPGGAIADRYSARSLLAASLVATAAGGLVMATVPSPLPMALLYAYWGFTTIFLFWGALIRATRDWGGNGAQGRAFGILDGGRGLLAAAMAALLVSLFASLMPEDAFLADAAERKAAFQQVILWYAAATFATGILVWFVVPAAPNVAASPVTTGMRIVLRRPVVWAQAAIIACAYCAFKGLDNYALYATQVLQMDEVSAARFATYGAYLRPVAAVAAGFLADRASATRVCGILFAVLVAASLLLGELAPARHGAPVILSALFVTFAAVFALRGVYFALLEENRVPARYTGAAVGLVSLVGFTPEIFFAPVAGRILDAAPGLPGHQHYFLFLSGIAAIGFAFVALLRRLRRRGGDEVWPVPGPANRAG
jgi:MFS transporter, GlpU family, inner membrane protein